MSKQVIANKLQSVFITHFRINTEVFSWNMPLEQLSKDFKILGYLTYLEHLLEQEFGTRVKLSDSISTAIHTPDDVLRLLMEQ